MQKPSITPLSAGSSLNQANGPNWKNMFGGIFKIILLLLLPTSLFATTAVTGKMQTLGTGNINSNAFMRFWLRGCSGNQPRVNGTGLIGPTQGGVFYFDIAADSSGNISGTIYSTRDSAGTGNGDIECGGSKTAVWYGMQAFVAGKGGPEVPVHAKNTATLDITQVTPITTNPVVTSPTGDSTYARVDAGNLPFTGNVDFSAAMRANNGGVLSGAFTGNHSETGQNTYTAYNINNIVTVESNKYATLSAAFADAACTNGCTIDMRGTSNATALNLGSFDPGNVPVTILLGAYTYTITQIKLRSNMHIYGAGIGKSISGSPATILQSCGSCTTTAPFILGTGVAPYPVQNVILSGFRLYAAPGNTTQLGMNFIAGSGGGGLWYSQFSNLCIGACDATHIGFMGGNIVFDGTAGGAPNGVHQFNSFYDVQSFRSAGGLYAFWAKGQNAQFTFNNVEFDGPGQSDTAAPNIWLGDGVAGLATPLTTFSFNELTCQTSAVCVSLNGAWDITFHHTHVEQVSGFALLTQGANSTGNIGIGIEDSYFAVNTGVNAGNGYLVKGVSGSNGVTFHDNVLVSTPDTFFTGITTGFAAHDNYGPGGNSNSNTPALNRFPSTIQVGNIQSSLASALTAGNVVLSAGFGTGNSVTNVATGSNSNTAIFTINNGNAAVGANPTVAVTFPFGFNASVLCSLEQTGGTNATLLFNQSSAPSGSGVTFTLGGTPTVNLNFIVIMRCGP